MNCLPLTTKIYNS